MKFRELLPSEIEVRASRFSFDKDKKVKGVTVLLYKDARCDMNILDETIGPERWQRKHYELKGNIYCSVGIFFENVGWIWKDDCGAESNVSKEKGEASDSFKRACVNWGIGRELYTAPKFMYIPADKANIFQDGQKAELRDTLSVRHVAYDNGTIKEIGIVNKNGDWVYKYKEK